MDELVFTPSAVMGLLSSIEELKDLGIDFYESDNSVIFTIGESQYEVKKNDAEEVEIPEEALEEVSEINDSGYEDLDIDEDVSTEVLEDEVVEGGIIKEFLKTLAIGGLVRLTKNALKNA